MFSLRIGYRYQTKKPDLGGLAGLTAGIGLRHNNMSLDYAFVPLGDLGQTHRISFNLRFRPHFAPVNMQATPAAAPPSAPSEPATPVAPASLTPAAVPASAPAPTPAAPV